MIAQDKVETWEALEAFRDAVIEERKQILRRRKVACVIARILLGFSAVGCFFLLYVALFTTTELSPLFWLLIVAWEYNQLRLGRALATDLKWPQPPNTYLPGPSEDWPTDWPITLQFPQKQ